MGTNVSAQLMQSPEFAPQVQGLDRQRKIAEMLMTQGFQPQQGQMVSGHYVAPSWTQNLAGLANIWAGKGMQEEAEQKQLDLAKALRGKEQQAVQDYWTALQGTPGTEGQAAVIPKGQTLLDDNGMLTYGAKAGIAGTPASGPDYARAFQSATGEYAPSWLTSHAVKSLEPVKLGEGESLMQRNPFTGKLEPLAGGGVKLPTDFKEAAIALNLPLDPSKWTPEQRAAVAQYGMQSKRATASQVNVPVYMGKDLSSQIGEFMKTARANVQAGNLNLEAANKIDAALNSGKINVGPTSTLQTNIQQVATVLGVPGKDTEEKLVNTRKAVQGLAQMWMSGREQMRGTGPITEGENLLAGKIASGNIDQLTIPELRYMTSNVKKMGNYYQKDYQAKLDVMKKDPELARLVPFYEVTPISEASAGGTATVVNRRPAE